jgi:hypothetical protein
MFRIDFSSHGAGWPLGAGVEGLELEALMLR